MQVDRNDLRICLDSLAGHGLDINPPAEKEEISEFERSVGLELPSSVRWIFEQCDGATYRIRSRVAMRPMSLTETTETLRDFRESAHPAWVQFHLLCTWTDDNSNYAGVFLDSDLAGMVAFVDHEEFDPAPRYWNLVKFMLAMFDSAGRGEGWWDLYGDFPTIACPTSHERTLAGERSADSLLARAAAETDRDAKRRLLMCAMNLLPSHRVDQLIALLSVEDMWLPERAAEILGRGRVEQAIPPLELLAEKRKPNGHFAALLALGRMASPPAHDALVRLARLATKDDALYYAKAFEACGAEVRRSGSDWHYRFGSDGWSEIG